MPSSESTTASADFEIHWIDREREPTQPPNPEYPDGIDVDLAGGRESCQAPLPHPTPRCGLWVVKCRRCATNAVITTAGRPDDPRSIKLPCQTGGKA